MKRQFFILSSFVLLFTGCFEQKNASCKPVLVKRVIKERSYTLGAGFKPKKDVITLSVVGEGIAPDNAKSETHAMVLAKRAAILDGYRQLGEKLYGVKLTAKDKVEDAILQNSKILSQVNAIIKNASIINNSYKDGLYRVMMELKISREALRRYLYPQDQD
ncbi:MAG: lipoprotein required for motility [Epsilonproteobacteria bacterium]|nr:lipoprotein required for motility [Campylobacterota bacterium]